MKETMSPPLCCSYVARTVGSGHKCNKKNSKKARNPYQVYRTNDANDRQLLWILLCKKRKLPPSEYGRRLSRRDVIDIENEFGSKEFCLCRVFARNLKEHIRLVPPKKKRKASAIVTAGENHAYPFSINDDDNSDAEYVCSVINRDQPTPVLPMTATITSPSTKSSSSAEQQPQRIIRRRSPRGISSPSPTNDGTSNNSNTNYVAPSMLQFSITHSRKRRRLSTISCFKTKLEQIEKECKSPSSRKKFTELSATMHGERTSTALCHLIMCAGYGSDDQIKDNANLYEDVNMVLISLKALLMKLTGLTDKIAEQTQVPMDDLGDDEVLSALGEMIALDNDEGNNARKSAEAKKESRMKLESILVSKMARDSYNLIVKTINCATDMGLRSYHLLSKDLPTTEDFKFEYEEDSPEIQLDTSYTQALNDDDMVTNNLMEEARLTTAPTSATSRSATLTSATLTSATSTSATLTSATSTSATLMSATATSATSTGATSTSAMSTSEKTICDGSVVQTKECLQQLMSKIEGIVKAKNDGTTLEKVMEGAFLILCPDGAVHPRMQATDQNIITYSMTLSSPYLVNDCGFYPTSGANILPHVQLRGKENVNTLRAVLKWRHMDLPSSLEGFPGLENCHVYDLADGKALYLMLDHAHWQCNLHPYLLCKCNRGDLICEGIMHDDEWIRLVKESQSQWNNRDGLTEERREFGDGTPYSWSVHKKWCGEENFGVCHNGAMPENYKISQIRFDVFHGRSAFIKVVTKYIRKLFEGLPRNVKLFSAFLRKLPCWDPYVVDPWISNGPTSRLKGRHTASFTKNIPECVKLLKEIAPLSMVDSLCKSLMAFYTMSQILAFVTVNKFDMVKHVLPHDTAVSSESSPDDVAKAVFDTYKQLAYKFREHGLRSFMTNRRTGDKETFYVHVITQYLPKIMTDTYQRHKLGVGIFSMEGFEYKNYTSKQVLNNRTNGKIKSNIVLQSMRILQLLFKCAYFDPHAEMKRRKVMYEKKISAHENICTIATSNVNEVVAPVVERV